MAFTTRPFRTSKEFIKAVDAYIEGSRKQNRLATAQGFCNSNHFRYDLYEGELQEQFPDAYAYAREAFFTEAVNAPRYANPTTVKAIIDFYLKFYAEIVSRNSAENKITVELDDETKKDAQ